MEGVWGGYGGTPMWIAQLIGIKQLTTLSLSAHPSPRLVSRLNFRHVQSLVYSRNSLVLGNLQRGYFGLSPAPGLSRAAISATFGA